MDDASNFLFFAQADGNQVGHNDSWFVDLSEWLEFYNSLFAVRQRRRLNSSSTDSVTDDNFDDHLSRTNSTCRRWVVNGLSGQRAAVYRLTCDLAHILHSTSNCDSCTDEPDCNARDSHDQNNVPLDLWTYCVDEFQRLIESHPEKVHIPQQVCAAQRMLSNALILDANDAGLTHSLRQACRQIFEWLQRKFWLDEFQRILLMSAAHQKRPADSGGVAVRNNQKARHSICVSSSARKPPPFVFAEERLFCDNQSLRCRRTDF